MLEQLQAAWASLEPRRRLTMGIVMAGSLLGIILVAYWSSRPSYATLYSGMAPEDASAVVEELRAAGVPYRLGHRGGSVEVPSSHLYETRLRLAGQGMPTRGSVGFELFDRSSLPGTDFSNAVNLQRALQGELSRTITSISEIKTARVHLSIPRESLYAEASTPSASVLLDTGPAGVLRADQVRGIAYLVASSVENLSHQNVTVVDTMGNVLHGGGTAGMDVPDSALSTARAYGEALNARLQTMLDAMFGPYRTIVRVQAELDMDIEEISEQLVEPMGDEQISAVAREHTAEEAYDGTGGRAGGVAGIPAAIMGGEMAAGQEREGNYRSSEQTREYEFSRRTSHRKRPPGRITRVTVAAVVDEGLAGYGVERVREVLEAAAGLDPARGDSIVVRPMKLRAAELAETEEQLADAERTARQRHVTLQTLMSRGLPVVIALLLLAVVARTAAGLRRAAWDAVDNGRYAEVADPHDPYSPSPDADAADGGQGTRAMDMDQVQEERTLAEELRKLAKERPDVLADELRNLVNSEDDL